MAKARYQIPLQVFEQPIRSPSTLEEAEQNRTPKILEKGKRVIAGRNPDEVLKKAKALLKEEGRIVRSASLGPDVVSVVVYAESEKTDPRTVKESRKAGGYR